MASAGYSTRSLPQKLGIPADGQCAVISAPVDVLDEIARAGYLTSRLDTTLTKPAYDYIHLFLSERAELGRLISVALPKLSKSGMLWISWPKKASKVTTDLDENIVRSLGLEQGVVDVKVCAVSSVWSGLKFVYRLADR